MANMSYCRFENTLMDVNDCVNVMDESWSFDDLDLNDYEKIAIRDMVGACQAFLSNYRRLEENAQTCKVDEEDEIFA